MPGSECKPLPEAGARQDPDRRRHMAATALAEPMVPSPANTVCVPCAMPQQAWAAAKVHF